VDSEIVSRDAYSTDYANFQGVRSKSDRTAHGTTVRLTWGLLPIVMLLISLGLWALIWVAGATLVSAALR
jgi:hypothetical protein